jgi:hypothetical protein
VVTKKLLIALWSRHEPFEKLIWKELGQWPMVALQLFLVAEYSFFSFISFVDPVPHFAWIRSLLAVLDTDPYWEFRSGTSSIEIDQNLHIFLCKNSNFI